MRTITRMRLAATDPRLGRHVHHDSESRRFAYRPRHTQLRAVRHIRHEPIWDQLQIGSCTCDAGLGCLATGPFYATLPAGLLYPLNQQGCYALYRTVTRTDPYAGAWEPDDTGSDGLSVAKTLTAAGLISGYLTPFGLPATLDALQDWPLITGINWYDGMFYPTAEGIVRPTGGLAGGHEVVVDEYDPVRGLVGFTNSWSLSWGLAGRFYLQAEDYGTLLEQQGDVTAFVPRTASPPTPTPDADHVFADVLRPWVAKRHTGCNATTARAAKTWLAAKAERRGQ